MYSRNLLKGECSPVKVAFYPLDYLFYFYVRDNRRSARPCLACTTIRGSFIKPFERSSPINFSPACCFAVRETFINKAPESYAAWCLMLSTSCFAFDVSHDCAIEGRGAIGEVGTVK
jgi:hypothetical protein